MPELPEVETVCRGLHANLPSATVRAVNVRRAGLRYPFPTQLAERLQGQRVQAISRRAKYICMHFEHGDVMLLHLGMSGSIRLSPVDSVPLALHDHLVITYSNGIQMVLRDPRRFGLVDLTTVTQLASHPLLAKCGVEPLGPEFTAAYLHGIFARTRMPIKTALMHAPYVVGVGNIYAAESLFLAGIHPLQPANTILIERLAVLIEAVQKVLRAAIESGGSTLRDYVRSSGESGYFQHQFQVYGKEGISCARCDSLIARCKQQGRSTFYCPNCQPLSSLT